jgi:dihydrofolate reductase
MTAPIGLIWAEAHDGVIGADGGMPWHVPEDLARVGARHCEAVALARAVEGSANQVSPG